MSSICLCPIKWHGVSRPSTVARWHLADDPAVRKHLRIEMSWAMQAKVVVIVYVFLEVNIMMNTEVWLVDWLREIFVLVVVVIIIEFFVFIV